jgi:competence protein ComEC
MNPELPLGECFFVDVGQGMANIVALPRGRVLMIDVGPRDAWPVLERLLLDRGVTSIECLLISHNDEDHIGGLDRCAMVFGALIQHEKFYLLQDRPLKPGDALDLTLKMADDKLIPEPRRAEAASILEPTIIWQEGGLSLELWYPSMAGAVRGISSGRPNNCCAVALLRVGLGSILFTGDASARSWRALDEAHPGYQLKVDIMTVPHHGGCLGGPESLNTLVKAKLAIISVGTHNAFGHPRDDVLSALKRMQTDVLCTEITEKCHQLEKLGDRHVVPISEYSLSHYISGMSRAAAKRPKACAGTVVAHLGREGIKVSAWTDHKEAAKRLDRPLCFCNGKM